MIVSGPQPTAKSTLVKWEGVLFFIITLHYQRKSVTVESVWTWFR